MKHSKSYRTAFWIFATISLVMLIIVIANFIGIANDAKSKQNSRETSTDVTEQQITSISFEGVSDIVYTGSSKTMRITSEPCYVSTKDLLWKSSNENVATVDNTGYVTAISIGECDISFQHLSGFSDSIHIVTKQGCEAVSIDTENLDIESLIVGDIVSLSAAVLPTDYEGTIEWKSSIDFYATVDTNGRVEAKHSGTVRISASIGGKSDEIQIVIKEQSPITIVDWRSSIDYVGGVEWNFKIRNNTDKNIKYVTIAWNCYNGVGDLIRDSIDGKTYKKVRFTGPLAAGTTSSSQRNTELFYNSTYREAKLTELTVEFMDGTSITVTSEKYDDIVETNKDN